MECNDVRALLLDYQRGRLDGDARAQVAAHLETCAGCARAAAADTALSGLLEQKLPRHVAPDALKRRLAERLGAPPLSRARPRRWLAPSVSAFAAAAAVLLVVGIVRPGFLAPPLRAADLIEEGVNDHLRVVASAHPVEIESGGIHQVKPWFTGRVDFAPPVTFAGDDEFTLAGGSVGYFRDRKAAVFVFKVRLHTATLLVFRGDGLPLPARTTAASARGFNVLLWRSGELGFCLVSDVNRADLERLAARAVAAP